ncbi:hypothetical protein JL722_11729 [Aureococcus anophagefferens]|nr:hypothetical protein JL722_11729 [Aureococcus anophagefferens]
MRRWAALCDGADDDWSAAWARVPRGAGAGAAALAAAAPGLRLALRPGGTPRPRGALAGRGAPAVRRVFLAGGDASPACGPARGATTPSPRGRRGALRGRRPRPRPAPPPTAAAAWDPAPGPRRPWWNEAALGCLRSQRRALRDAAARGDGALLLLEDDAILDANVVAKVRAWTAHRAFARVPWHLLYLGGNHDLPPAELSDDDDDDDDDGGGGAPCRLVRARRTVALHAVLVHRRAFAGAGVLALLDTEAAPSDILLARDYQPRFPCFVLEPRLATQRRGHSDIRGEIVDYAALLGGAPTGDT